MRGKYCCLCDNVHDQRRSLRRFFLFETPSTNARLLNKSLLVQLSVRFTTCGLYVSFPSDFLCFKSPSLSNTAAV